VILITTNLNWCALHCSNSGHDGSVWYQRAAAKKGQTFRPLFQEKPFIFQEGQLLRHPFQPRWAVLGREISQKGAVRIIVRLGCYNMLDASHGTDTRVLFPSPIQYSCQRAETFARILHLCTQSQQCGHITSYSPVM